MKHEARTAALYDRLARNDLAALVFVVAVGRET
jgi:hypothetical protein